MIQLALPQRMTWDAVMMNRVLATAITVGWTGLASTLAGRRPARHSPCRECVVPAFSCRLPAGT
jgi:hypothetical protein